MHRYNQKVGLLGLLLGLIILAIGFATDHARLAGSLAMATILTSVLAAYYHPAGNDPDRTTASDQEHESRERGAPPQCGSGQGDGPANPAAAQCRPSNASYGFGEGRPLAMCQRAWP